MAKIVDVESGVDPIPVEEKKDTMTDAEKMMQNLMRRAYALGVQSGVRTMCMSMLSQMTQTSKMNPQKQINLLRQMCLRNIENQNKAAAQSAENPTTNTTTNNEKENESNV